MGGGFIEKEDKNIQRISLARKNSLLENIIMKRKNMKAQKSINIDRKTGTYSAEKKKEEMNIWTQLWKDQIRKEKSN